RHRPLRVGRVLDEGPHHARRPLGAKRELLAVLLEGVHLLLDDVRRFPDRAHEERGGFDDRGPHLAVLVHLGHGTEGLLEPLPSPDFFGENVVHPLDGAKVHKPAGLCSVERPRSIGKRRREKGRTSHADTRPWYKPRPCVHRSWLGQWHGWSSAAGAARPTKRRVRTRRLPFSTIRATTSLASTTAR